MANVVKRFALAFVLMFAAALAASAAQGGGAQADEFQVVSGDGYEGAIVPASAPWHAMFGIAIIGGRGRDVVLPPDLTPWTPRASDIAATERYFADFVARAVKEPLQMLATLPDEDRANVARGLPWLAANVQTLKRQYWGFASGSIRRISVHGAPDDMAGQVHVRSGRVEAAR